MYILSDVQIYTNGMAVCYYCCTLNDYIDLDMCQKSYFDNKIKKILTAKKPA